MTQLSVALGISIVVMGVACYGGNLMLRSATDDLSAMRTSNVLASELNSTLSTMKDVETGQRGYLLTGRASYLQPYEAGRREIRVHLSNLERMTAHDAEEARLVRRAEYTIGRKLDELERTVKLEMAGNHRDAMAVVVTDSGKQYMDEIRSLFDVLERREESQLARLAESNRRSFRFLAVLIDGFPAVAVALLIWLFSMARRNLHMEQMTAERIRRNEEELQLILDHVPALVSYLDRDERYVRANAEYERWMGCPRAEIIGKTVREVVGDATYAAVSVQLKAALAGDPHSYSYEAMGAYRDGRKRVRVSYALDREPSGDVRGVVALITDISELWQTQENLRQLSHRILEVQDDERRRISRELHDSTAQHVAAVSLLHQRMKRAVSGGAMSPDKMSRDKMRQVEADIEQADELARLALNELRSISYVLHPPLLDELGLPAALEWLVDGIRNRTELAIELSIAEPLERFGPEVELAAYRVVQEALSNVMRHSGATRAKVTVTDGDALRVTVEDNGKGFDAARGPVRGIGLAGMAERVDALQGSMEVRSQNGVRITACFPLERRGLAA